jgi:hypothetical protein
MFGNLSSTERAARAARVLKDYGLSADPMDAITNLLCDVRHFCESSRIGFEHQDMRANEHFLYERKPRGGR